MQEQDFLQGYEIKNFEFSPRVIRFLGLGTLLNFLMIFGLGQTNLLHSKACDGPFVGKVCQVLDMMYVSGKLFSGDNGYVVREYDKTEIGDADEIIWVDETGKGPAFAYPQGFFKPEESEDLLGDDALNNNPIAEIMPTPNPIYTPPSNNSSSNNLLGRRQKLPKRNRNVAKDDLPDDPLGNIGVGDEKNKKPKKDKPTDSDGTTADNKKPKDDGKDIKKNPLDKTTAKNSKPVGDMDFINKKPLQDFADEVLEKWESKKVDLSSKFRIKMVGALTKDGRLDPKRSKFSEMSGDPAMVELAKRAIESVGDSGWLDYLSRFEVKKADFIFEQDDKRLFAVVDSSLPTLEKANTVATGLRGIIQGALLFHRNGLKKLEPDVVALLNAAKVSSDGKLLRINFELPKEVAQKMINGQLKESQAKKLKDKKDKTTPKPQTKPNGSAEKMGENANSAK